MCVCRWGCFAVCAGNAAADKNRERCTGNFVIECPSKELADCLLMAVLCTLL